MTDDRRLLPRYRTDQKPLELHETTQRPIDPSSPAGKRALRGIPCIAQGVTGTAPDTDPVHYVIDEWCGCGRRKQREYPSCKTCYRRAS